MPETLLDLRPAVTGALRVAHDVLAPQRAGLRAIWLNRGGLPRPAEVRAEQEVSTLTDLPQRIHHLSSTPD